MKVHFPYPQIEPLTILDENLLGIFSPGEAPYADEDDIIRDGLEHPIGSERLGNLVRPDQSVLILSDDNTRLTPVKKILPLVLQELQEAGVPEQQIRIMIAGGTHRHMTQAELLDKLGAEILSRFTILQNHWNNPQEIVKIGDTPQGTPIEVNRHVLEADFVIGIGHIVPHRVSGFSGGSKIIQPGVCGEHTTGFTHWLSAKFSGEEIMGTIDNPVRQEMNEVARQVGFRFLINTVQDHEGHVVKLVSGDIVKAFRAGAKFSKEIFGVRIPRKAPIVIVDSYPADIELWQAAKGIYAADLAVADGGVVILVTPCPEGVSVQHHRHIVEFGYRPYREVQEVVMSGQLKELAVAAHLVHGGAVFDKGGRVILVSPGIDEPTTKKLQFDYAASPAQALEQAYALVGHDAEVMVLNQGGEILPLL